MKSILTTVLVATLCGSAFAQIASGPAAGSIPSGAIVNTDNFESSDAPFIGNQFKVHNHPEVAPLPDPANLPPPTGPAGSNYVEDPSIRNGDTPPPPITLGSFNGIGQTAFLPPDPHIAVGPNHIISMVNSTFRISDKSGNAIKTISCNSWMNSVVPGVSVSDPKVLYDHFANRWIMSWIEQVEVPPRANYLVSVSDDSDPMGVWYNFALPSNVNGTTSSGNWADYQGMGIDNEALYFTSNQFAFGGNYQYVKIRIVSKADLYANTAGPVHWNDFWNLRDAVGNGVIGTRPSVVFGTPGVYYLIGNSPFTTSTYFVLYRITNPLTSPAISAVHVPVVASTVPPNAQQLGGGNPINGGGFNLGMRNEPVYMDSSLWVVHSIASAAGYSNIRYVRINTVTNTAEEDAAFGADGYWHFFPAMMVDQNKNMLITYSRSATTEYAGAYYSWRLSTDPPGLRGSIVTQPGLGNYSGGRWGDYFGAAADPTDRNNIWMIAQYANTGNSWGTWIHGARLVPFSGVRILSSTSSRDFGRVEGGKSSDTTEITISNIGSSNLIISNITKSQSAYTLLNLPAFPRTLTSFDSLKIKVYFRPTAQGIVTDTIRVSTNDSGTPVYKIALIAKGVVIGKATAGIIYAASGPPATSSIYTINPTSGLATVVGGTGLNEIQGLAIHPVTRELYGVFSSASATELYRISATFGDALPAKTLPLGNARAVTFANDGSLYAGTNTGRLYRINIITGDTTFIGPANGIVYSGLSLNPLTGKLWASVRPPITGRDRIYTVNPSDGDTAFVGITGGGNITPYLAFDARGKLYALKGTSTQIDTLIVIDTTTAFGTRVGPLEVAGVNALVIRTDSAGTLGVQEISGNIPQKFLLEQNYPNPFNPSTRIRFSLPAGSSKLTVSLRIYDIVGREVAVLVNEEMEAGTYEAVFDAAKLASGTYLYKLQAGSFVETKKMLLMK